MTRPDNPATLAELSGRAVLLGMVIGVVMTAANTYLGLYAGMTVSAHDATEVVRMAEQLAGIVDLHGADIEPLDKAFHVAEAGDGLGAIGGLVQWVADRDASIRSQIAANGPPGTR